MFTVETEGKIDWQGLAISFLRIAIVYFIGSYLIFTQIAPEHHADAVWFFNAGWVLSAICDLLGCIKIRIVK